MAVTQCYDLDPEADIESIGLGALLAITTGFLVTDLDEFYEAQDWLAGRPLTTHERVGRDELRVREHVLRTYPRLAEAHPPAFAPDEHGSKEAAVRAWVESVAEYLGWDFAWLAKAPAHEGS